MTNMTKEEALAKLDETFPGQLIAAEVIEELMKHPGGTPTLRHECRIYSVDLGYKCGITFEECFKQI